VRRYCPKEHGLLWSSFAESLVSSWQLVTATLSRDFDVLSLLMPLLAELFARVQASVLVPMTGASGRSNAPTPSASYANFLELGEVGTGPAAVPEVGIYYQPVYVDLLLVLAEQLVTVTKSGVAVSFLQSVWKWLQALTTIKQHKQQAATQLKRDLQSKQLVPPSFGVSSGFLFPSNLTAIAPLATAEADRSDDAPASHEAHADKALLESIARVTVFAQSGQHLHSISVPEVAGTSPAEAARVMQNLHTTGMWHLVDNVSSLNCACGLIVFFTNMSIFAQAMLCFALPVSNANEAQGATSDSAFTSHVSALMLVVKILSEAATQSELPNARNSAVLGLVKLSSQVLLLAEKGELGCQAGSDSVVLSAVFYDVASVYLAHYGHTLDVTYRHVLQQLLSSAATEPRRRAGPSVGGKRLGDVELLVELMSHIFAQPSAAPLSTNTLPSVFMILQSAMKMLCVELQTSGGALGGGFRDFATAHAALSRNTFVLLVPPPLPVEEEEKEELDDEEPEQLLGEDFAAATSGPALSSASSAGGQFNGFDDDLLGGWSSAAAVLQPTVAARPAMTATANVSLLDAEDMWIFDAPLVPEKSAKVSMTASIKAGALDFFGQSSQPLVPGTASKKQVTAAAGDAFAPSVQPVAEAEAPRKPIILFRDIYDEDEPFSAPTAAALPEHGPESAMSITSNSTFSPTIGTDAGIAKNPASAFAATSAHAAAPAAHLDWPADDGAHTGDGFDFLATASPAFDSWGGVDTAAHNTLTPHLADDGFAPTTVHFGGATPSITFTSTTGWPSDGDFLPLTTNVPATTAIAEDGFGDLSAFGSSPTATGKTGGGVTRRSSFGPTGTAALSAEEVSALAAAKRANRRASVGASIAQSKLAADPFFSAGALVPSPAAGVTAPSKSADGWPGAVSSDGFPVLTSAGDSGWGSSPAGDGFGSSDVFASTATLGGSLTAADDGFSATPADFVATASTAGPGPGYYEGYPPAYPGYPPVYDPAVYAAYPPAAAAPYSHNYPQPTDPTYAQQQQGYASAGYGHAPYPAASYAVQPGYSDPHYHSAYGYPAAGYYPPPAQAYAQQPAAYSHSPAAAGAPSAHPRHGAQPSHAGQHYPYQAPTQQH